jgi:hypothetical protein
MGKKRFNEPLKVMPIWATARQDMKKWDASVY